MSPLSRRRLASAATKCRTIVSAGHASCEDGRTHVMTSRSAIARSLELLSRTSYQVAHRKGDD